MRLLLIISLLFSLSTFSQQKIHIDWWEIWNTTGLKNPELLFDGSVASGNKMDQEGYQNNQYARPMVFWLALDSAYRNIRIDYFHGFGGSNWTVTLYDSLRNNSRKYIFNGVYNNTATVKGTADTPFPVRFIRFEASDPSSDVREIYLYGDAVAMCSPIRPAYAPAPGDPGKYFQGFGSLYPNQQHDDAGWSLRWQQDMNYVDTCVKCLPNLHTYVFSKFQNDYTDSYKPAKDAGRKWTPYMAGPSRAFMFTNTESKDIPHGADSLNPVSWINQYRVAYAYVKKFDLEEIEVGNEDDAKWVNNLRYHSPAVKVQKMRQGYYGAKHAKPSVQVVNGALTGWDTVYLKAQLFESYLKCGSMDSAFFDRINFNHYSTTGGEQHKSGTRGVSPEQDRVYEKTIAIRRTRDRWFPGKAIQWSEFGYDSLNSNYSVPDIPGVANRGITKANWVIRSFEIGAAAKWDRMYQYTERDQGGGDFGTSGFEYVGKDQQGRYQTYPNRLYWYMTCRAIRLQNYNAWPEVIRNGGDTGLWVLRYSHVSNDSVVYSFWMGTSNNSKESVIIDLSGAMSATLVTMTEGVKAGMEKGLTVKEGRATVVADESVQYILTGAKEQPLPIRVIVARLFVNGMEVIVFSDRTAEVR